ncbi:MAG: exo-alpha-sialidase [Bacteroidaceae bacterium]|nr:exo-alpha-sialidase [Bacteroidaceae bacterium]
MKNKVLIMCFGLFMGCVAMAQEVHFSTQKIWDNGTYSSFTSLLKYQGRYYCTFREGESHIFDKDGNAEGRIRVIVSQDGVTWESALLVGEKGVDLRDPKLSVTPDGRLMLSIGGSIYRERKLMGHVPYVCFSKDGRKFGRLHRVKVEGEEQHKMDWIWRTTWHDGVGYTVNYFSSKEAGKGGGLSLMSTTDGLKYKLLTEFSIPDFPNESTIRFLPDGRMLVMVRRDKGDAMGYWGVSRPPYQDWEWKKMEMRLGGPDFVVQDEQNILMGSRTYYIPSRHKMALYKGRLDGHFEEMCILPSGGDCSYPGLLVEGNELWVSYYSSHEDGRARIYLSRIPLDMLK